MPKKKGKSKAKGVKASAKGAKTSALPEESARVRAQHEVDALRTTLGAITCVGRLSPDLCCVGQRSGTKTHDTRCLKQSDCVDR